MTTAADPSPPSGEPSAGVLPGPTSAHDLNPERWVDDHGDYLFHYALSRLRDRARAEDFVQEALLAALRSTDRYLGRSCERSWLTGILKHKLLDHFRKAGRETNFSDLEFYGEEEGRTFENQAFPDHWNAACAPTEWEEAGRPSTGRSSGACSTAARASCRNGSPVCSSSGRWTTFPARRFAERLIFPPTISG